MRRFFALFAGSTGWNSLRPAAVRRFGSMFAPDRVRIPTTSVARKTLSSQLLRG